MIHVHIFIGSIRLDGRVELHLQGKLVEHVRGVILSPAPTYQFYVDLRSLQRFVVHNENERHSFLVPGCTSVVG